MLRIRTALLSFGVVTAVLAAVAQPALAGPPSSPNPAERAHPSCSTSSPGQFRCFSQWRTGGGVSTNRANPSGPARPIMPASSGADRLVPPTTIHPLSAPRP